MAVSVNAVIALHELVNSRNDELNEKAYLRAMDQEILEHNRRPDSYISAAFKLSQDVSTTQMTKERLARERILKMQADISRHLARS